MEDLDPVVVAVDLQDGRTPLPKMLGQVVQGEAIGWAGPGFQFDLWCEDDFTHQNTYSGNSLSADTVTCTALQKQFTRAVPVGSTARTRTSRALSLAQSPPTAAVTS